jgi:hypothetical protein
MILISNVPALGISKHGLYTPRSIVTADSNDQTDILRPPESTEGHAPLTWPLVITIFPKVAEVWRSLGGRITYTTRSITSPETSTPPPPRSK